MYQITDQQIEFITNDIRARGVEMESLQDDLTDHICCIIEQQFEEGGNFEQFYHSLIPSFYKKKLSEIEEETKMLLNNKNYYTMKKIMIVSGITSTLLIVTGIAFKFLHLQGAAVCIVAGISLFSLLFLPLMVVLKIKEKNNLRDKSLATIGTLVAILISMATMFKIMHWPFANMMGLSAVGILFILYLPVNLVTGLRNPDTKVNTVVSSILLVAGCGLFLSLVRSPQASHQHYKAQTEEYIRFYELVEEERAQLFAENGKAHLTESGAELLKKCNELESYILEQETGQKEIDMNYKESQLIGDTYLYMFFSQKNKSDQKIIDLKNQINKYNETAIIEKLNKIPNELPIFNIKNGRVTEGLNALVQIELMVYQNERKVQHNKG